MIDPSKFDAIVKEAEQAVAQAAPDLDAIRTRYLGRKGKLTTLLRQLQDLPLDKRKAFGQAGNQAKRRLTSLIEESAKKLSKPSKTPTVDVTLPGQKFRVGHIHPITQVLQDIEEIFTSMGFDVVDGPEVEDDWHNFEALNMGPDHPARDMQDTFYIAGSEDSTGHYRFLPRTHTSNLQIRTMEKTRPPLRIISPGKAYRNEAEDATHSAVFHQVEGLMVDETVTFSDLKGVLTVMVKRLLGEDTRLRFRPSFFPYTEPSAEIDVSSPRIRKGEWLELGGAGMVHPNVLKAVKYDPKHYRGFAFGLGPDRIAMLKYGIQDLRLFYNPDVRLLEQF